MEKSWKERCVELGESIFSGSLLQWFYLAIQQNHFIHQGGEARWSLHEPGLDIMIFSFYGVSSMEIHVSVYEIYFDNPNYPVTRHRSHYEATHCAVGG